MGIKIWKRKVHGVKVHLLYLSAGARDPVSSSFVKLSLTDQPVKDDPSFDYATVAKAQSVDNVGLLCKSRGEKSNSISTTSSCSEPNEVLSEYTGLGDREPIKSSAYTALVRQQTSESKSCVATCTLTNEFYSEGVKQPTPLQCQEEHRSAKVESPIPSAAVLNLVKKNQQRAISIALKMKNDATC